MVLLLQPGQSFTVITTLPPLDAAAAPPDAVLAATHPSTT